MSHIFDTSLPLDSLALYLLPLVCVGQEHARQPHRHRKNKTKAGVLVLVFLVFFPLLFVLGLQLPDSFSEISSAAGGAASVAASDSGKGKGVVKGFLHAHFDLVSRPLESHTLGRSQGVFACAL